jgi:hypothetical protein
MLPAVDSVKCDTVGEGELSAGTSSTSSNSVLSLKLSLDEGEGVAVRVDDATVAVAGVISDEDGERMMLCEWECVERPAVDLVLAVSLSQGASASDMLVTGRGMGMSTISTSECSISSGEELGGEGKSGDSGDWADGNGCGSIEALDAWTNAEAKMPGQPLQDYEYYERGLTRVGE